MENHHVVCLFFIQKTGDRKRNPQCWIRTIVLFSGYFFFFLPYTSSPASAVPETAQETTSIATAPMV